MKTRVLLQLLQHKRRRKERTSWSVCRWSSTCLSRVSSIFLPCHMYNSVMRPDKLQLGPLRTPSPNLILHLDYFACKSVMDDHAPPTSLCDYIMHHVMLCDCLLLYL